MELLSKWWIAVSLLYYVNTANTEFVVSPTSAYVPLGSNATFICQPVTTVQHTSYIIVTDSQEHYDTVIREEVLNLEQRGIFLQQDGAQLRLTVLASLHNNGTKVSCRELLFPSPPSFSDSAILTVIGPPLPPVLTATTFIPDEILLEWEEPFTWPNHDILGYNIKVLSPDGSERSFNTSVRAHTYVSTLTREEREACSPLTFVISAYSDLGWSDSHTLTATLPIVPVEIGEVTSEVTFKQDGTPTVTVNLLNPPQVCEPQTATVTLEVRTTDSSYSLPVAVEEYSSHLDQLSFSLTAGLVTDTSYISTITVSTGAGSVSTTLPFNTILYQATEDIADTAQPTSHFTELWLGLTVGVCLLLILTVISLVAALLYKRHSRRVPIESDAEDLSFNNQISKEKLTSSNNYII